MTQLNKHQRQKRRVRQAEAKVLAEIAGRLAPEDPMPRNHDDFLDGMRHAHSYSFGAKSFGNSCDVIKINCIA
jgi:hypothetical protein